MTEHCPMCGAELPQFKATGKLRMTAILRAVSQVSELPEEAITGPRKFPDYCAARHLTAYLIRQMCPNESFPAIGRFLGRRDHCTVITSARRGAELIAGHEVVRRWYEDALRVLARAGVTKQEPAR